MIHFQEMYQSCFVFLYIFFFFKNQVKAHKLKTKCENKITLVKTLSHKDIITR